MSQIITSPSQMFRHNDATEPTHICFVFKLTTNRGPIIPKFDCNMSSGVLFRVRSYAAKVYTCELYVPDHDSPEISDPVMLGAYVMVEFVRKMSPMYGVELVGTVDYTRYHSDDTSPDECYS
jgi:hypothetical protein